MSTNFPPPQFPMTQTVRPAGQWVWNGSSYVWQQQPPPPPPPPPFYPPPPPGKPDPLQLIGVLFPFLAPQLGLPAQALQLIPAAIGLAELLKSGAAGPDKLAFAMNFLLPQISQFIPGFGDDPQLVKATQDFVSALVNHFNRIGVLQKSIPAAQPQP